MTWARATAALRGLLPAVAVIWPDARPVKSVPFTITVTAAVPRHMAPNSVIAGSTDAAQVITGQLPCPSVLTHGKIKERLKGHQARRYGAVMAYTCEDCRARKTGPSRTSLTGRTLCPDCADRLDGLAVGMISGGSTGRAIATQGWLSRVREARRRRTQ